jgi:hypothetical protein
MRTIFRMLFVGSFVLAIVITLVIVPQQVKTGEVSKEVMQTVRGGGGETGGCVETSFSCLGDGFQYSKDCTGCANVAMIDNGDNSFTERDPNTITLGTYENGKEITTTGTSTKTSGPITIVNCTALTTCDYEQSEYGYVCGGTVTSCKYMTPGYPHSVCHNVSGNPPTEWTTKNKGTCIDP